jgi:putative acyl-CoA dehydrogenase
MALALEAALMVQHAPPEIADAFCATRLADRHGLYGALPAAVDTAEIVDRAAITI